MTKYDKLSLNMTLKYDKSNKKKYDKTSIKYDKKLTRKYDKIFYKYDKFALKYDIFIYKI